MVPHLPAASRLTDSKPAANGLTVPSHIAHDLLISRAQSRSMLRTSKTAAAILTILAVALPAAAIPAMWDARPAAALAPDPLPSTVPTTTSVSTEPALAPISKAQRQATRAQRREERLERFAEALGVDPEAVKAARLEALDADLAARVDNGSISRKWADELSEAAHNGTLREPRAERRAARWTRR